MQEFFLDLTEECLHIKITENIETFWKGLTLNQQQPQERQQVTVAKFLTSW